MNKAVKVERHRNQFALWCPDLVIPVTLQWLPCQAPGVAVSVLGPVGPVSVYCDWVR